MKNIERGSIKYLIVLISLTTISSLILFPLFDLLSDLLVKEDFTYSLLKHVISPIIFAVTYGITFWALDKRKNK